MVTSDRDEIGDKIDIIYQMNLFNPATSWQESDDSSAESAS